MVQWGADRGVYYYFVVSCGGRPEFLSWPGVSDCSVGVGSRFDNVCQVRFQWASC
jgi:hypothetical protein